MKNLFILFVIFITYVSCYEDKGNYDYIEVPEINIAGLQEDYTVLAFDTLRISPTITTTNGETDYSYLWITQITDSKDDTQDTISREKELEWVAAKEAGRYDLLFIAKNKTTEVERRKRMNVEIATTASNGWYVLKNIGDESDIDYFSKDSTIVGYDVLKSMFEFRLVGKGKRLSWFRARFIELAPRLYVLSENDMAVLDVANGVIVRKGSEVFYDPAKKVHPQRCLFSNSGIFLMNDYNLYEIYTVTLNTGHWGTSLPIEGGDKNKEYRLSEFTAAYQNNGPLLWEELSSSFMWPTISYSDNKLKTFPEQTVKPSLTNMNYDLLFMGTRQSGSTQGAALMKEKDKEQYMMFFLDVQRYYTMAKYPLAKMFEVDPTSGLISSQMRAACPTVYGMYFIEGKKLKLYRCNESGGTDIDLEKDIPVDEEPAFIQVDRYDENLLIWGTRSGEKYTVRIWSIREDGTLDKEIRTLYGVGDPVWVKDVSQSSVGGFNG